MVHFDRWLDPTVGPNDGHERFRLYTFAPGNDWLVVSPHGYFDASPAARRFVTYRVRGPLTLVADDATRESSIGLDYWPKSG